MVHSVTVCCRVLFKFPRKAKRTCLSLCLFASIFEALLVFFFSLQSRYQQDNEKKKITHCFALLNILSLYCKSKYPNGSFCMPIQLTDVVSNYICLVSEGGYDGSCVQCSLGKIGAL